jgi:hypothetical protein
VDRNREGINAAIRHEMAARITIGDTMKTPEIPEPPEKAATESWRKGFRAGVAATIAVNREEWEAMENVAGASTDIIARMLMTDNHTESLQQFMRSSAYAFALERTVNALTALRAAKEKGQV